MSQYDSIIIGAGMSGMAAGIRLAMYDKKVLILERHMIPGGLNSYYRRGKRKFDVGLHAMTNFVPKGTKRAPLTKLLKQLRLRWDDLDLTPQKQSRIVFPEYQLTFNNNFETLLASIESTFPNQIDGFVKLVAMIREYNETALDNEYLSAKEVVRKFINNESLLEMIFCPLLIYGSAWEHDMDFSQFVIMFKSIFLEGFCRPRGGVRTVIDLLTKTMEEKGCEVRYRTGVKEIVTENGRVTGVLTDKDEFIAADQVISSAGLPETMKMTGDSIEKPRTGKMSFTETILVSDKKPYECGLDDTIIFYNNRPTYDYRKPNELYDNQSAVICFPNNFAEDDNNEGIVRITNMANYDLWKQLEKEEYKLGKERVYRDALALTDTLMPGYSASVQFKDVFTPTTVERYTSHFGGTVYGSPDKSRDGRTSINGLYICGTDQGFLGIVGAMLSGISMANLHGLMGDA